MAPSEGWLRHNKGRAASLFSACIVILHFVPSCGLFQSHPKNVQGFRSLCVVVRLVLICSPTPPGARLRFHSEFSKVRGVLRYGPLIS